MGNFQSRLLVAVASAYVCHAYKFDVASFMKIQAMQRQFTDDKILGDQQQALMHVAGFNDMELFMSKQLSAEQLKESLKAEYRDKMIQGIMQGGGIDISNPLWRRKFFDDKSDTELFTESIPEPMQSILRLSKEDNPEYKAYGKQLLKTVQYKKMNRRGNIMTENMDQIMMSENKAETIKDLLKQQMLQQIADPLDRAMMYNMQQQQATDDPVEKAKLKEDIRDLQTIKLFQGQIPEVSPVTSDDLYAFHNLARNPLNEADILNAALGEQLQGVSELDFERYFGSSAKQFSCRSHPSRLRVPCGINPSADECLASGCCFNPTSDDKSVPSCYHDLYGKVGSALLRRSFIESDETKMSEIKNLFKNSEIPTLQNLLKEDYDSLVAGPQEIIPSMANGNTNWWEAAKVEGEDGTPAVHLIKQDPAPKYGRPGFQWKAHGPTASPYLERYPGVNPTAAPGASGLDTYYQMWLEYTDNQDQAECALINPSSRVKCMDNFEALKDKIDNDIAQKAKSGVRSKCQSAGCCFNEDSFLSGNHACYRASDYGTCANLPSNFDKKECGYDGISEGECLTNARCCYSPTHVQGQPWCFYKYSATLEEDAWCDAWNLIENRKKDRTPCWKAKASTLFDHQSNGMSDINNLVSEQQCIEAGCCYDPELTTDALDWIVNGLGMQSKMYKCFAKINPALEGDYVEINNSKNGDMGDLAKHQDWKPTEKTCIQSQWADGKIFKQSCGENLSYYQCVYVNKCCYKATVTNEPTCYKPEDKA